MRPTLFEFPTRARGPVSRVLVDLDKRIRRLAERQVDDVRGKLGAYAICEPSLSALRTVSWVSSVIRDLCDGSDFTPQHVATELDRAHAVVQQAVVVLDVVHSFDPARLVLQSTAREIGLTLDELRPHLPVVHQKTAIAVPGVHLPTELLFDAQHYLFPPERMALISGRAIDGKTLLTTAFDVTPPGPVNSGHVSGDPQRLAGALIAMERAGAYLAAWIHSHPWRGAEATQPSSTDRQQYADLVRHYTKDLVGIIVVSDGHFRIWGDAVESGHIQLQLVGDGVQTICEENHVYRLV